MYKTLKRITDVLAWIVGIGFIVFVITAISICLDATTIFYKSIIFKILCILAIPKIAPLVMFLVKKKVKTKIRDKRKATTLLEQEERHNTYIQTYQLFKFCSTRNILETKDMKYIIFLINKSLGQEELRYRNYTFKTFEQEIYIKLRNKNLTKENMLEIKEYLLPYAQAYSLKLI